MSGSDVDEIRRREQIRRFAAAYATALGLTGNDATTIQHEIEKKLVAREFLDDAVLVNRVRQMQRDEELSRLMGTSVEQIDRTYGHLLPDSLDRARTALDSFGAVQGKEIAYE